MFLFRGMPFIDLAHLRKQDVIGNYIIYSRHKTGRQMTVRIPQEAAVAMMEMVQVELNQAVLEVQVAEVLVEHQAVAAELLELLILAVAAVDQVN